MNKVLISLSSVSLGVGLVAPTMTIVPKAGEITWIIEVLDPESMLPVTYSIIGIINELAELKEWFLVFVLTFFSIIFPISKLYFFWAASNGNIQNIKLNWIALTVGKLNKFSMAEVFVLSLVLISLKSLPGGTEVQIEYGCLIYFLSVIISSLSSFQLLNKSIVQ